MIIRVYRAKVQPGKHAEYEWLIRRQILPLLRGQPGLVALKVGTPDAGSLAEYVAVSIWQDRASLEGFAGPNWRAPVLLPGEETLVREVVVHHYLRLGDAGS